MLNNKKGKNIVDFEEILLLPRAKVTHVIVEITSSYLHAAWNENVLLSFSIGSPLYTPWFSSSHLVSLYLSICQLLPNETFFEQLQRLTTMLSKISSTTLYFSLVRTNERTHFNVHYVILNNTISASALTP